MFNMVKIRLKSDKKRSKKASIPEGIGMFQLRSPIFDIKTPQKSKVSRNYARF
jgi:hypothetical protein